MHSLRQAVMSYGEGAVQEMAAACKNETLSQIETLAEEVRCNGLNLRVSAHETLRRRIEQESARSLTAGFRDDDDPGRMRIAWNIRSLAGRRFTLARLVADHLASRVEERLLPATNVSTSKQQFQRAFAQEFLCPYNTLQAVIGTGVPAVDDIERAVEHFDVSPWVVVCTLVNNGGLTREALTDWGVL